MAELHLSGITKQFGPVEVLKGIDLAIADGEFIVLLGPSGCGKSTLLRIIAGLEDQTQGEVQIAGEPIDHLPPAKRGIAMVFQTYALYPHLDVAGNWALGLRQAGERSALIDERIKEASRILELDALLGRKPSELSGGQRQRVAIGRAIVRHPKVFLFDEPLSNLDAALRSQVRFEIARLHKRLRSTMVYVTHDQIEAMTLADRIVVMHDGVVQQIGSPRELYETPANRFVAGFIGSPAMNFLSDVVVEDGAARLANGAIIGPIMHQPDTSGRVLGVRPDGLDVARDGEGVPASVILTEYLGRESYVHVEIRDQDTVVIEVPSSHDFELGEQVNVRLKAGHAHLFD
ncbi:MAG: ABC transporter ATP-binding protein [Geminicoccaceae bacterium]